MANEIVLLTPTTRVGQGTVECSGVLTITTYVAYVASPLAGEGISKIFNMFQNQSIYCILFEGDSLHTFTIDRINRKVILTVQATGAQAAAGINATTRFTAKGKG